MLKDQFLPCHRFVSHFPKSFSFQDVAGFGEMSISYLKNNLGISNFGILVPQDSYGLGFQQVSIEVVVFHNLFPYHLT
jgi:hypothetical protein